MFYGGTQIKDQYTLIEWSVCSNVHQLRFTNLLNYKKIMTAHTSDEQHPSGELMMVLHSQVPKRIKAA